jgi:hypothetical protein
MRVEEVRGWRSRCRRRRPPLPRTLRFQKELDPRLDGCGGKLEASRDGIGKCGFFDFTACRETKACGKFAGRFQEPG